MEHGEERISYNSGMMFEVEGEDPDCGFPGYDTA
jgi:hypothetical protein